MIHPPLTTPGQFAVGCNYWASHAGTKMWKDWQPAMVEADFRQLSVAGLQLLRVFPLWPDFQPIEQLYAGGGQPQEIRMGETALVASDMMQKDVALAGVSPLMLSRFAQMADLAEKYHLKLIVGLVTGWMSGRLFVPPALQGRNVITDPVALMWQMRFVRCFVHHLKDRPAILAWDLGNECNVMAPAPSHEAAYLWTASITGAIRREDTTRPIVSGMHSLDEPNAAAAWRIPDQAELLEVLTTHPYPLWSPHTDQDAINTLRTLLHSTAQTRWYADIGQTHAFVEETGTMGPMISSDKTAADFLRTVLFSLWAHDCRALLWWCAYDQKHLSHPPYDWQAVERELGLFRVEGEARTPKPALQELTAFRAFMDQLPFESLPPRRAEAVCILTDHQEQWGVALSSFILAKQAGLEMEFQYCNQPLRPAKVYLVPSISGTGPMPGAFWRELLAQVEKGAVLYVSMQDGFLSPFDHIFGVTVESRTRRSSPVRIHFLSADDADPISLQAPIQLKLRLQGAEALASESDGNPIFIRSAYGQGCVYFLGAPLESALADVPAAFDAPYWRIYQSLADHIAADKLVHKTEPSVGVTEHALSEQKAVIVVINYSPEARQAFLSFAADWQPEHALHGALPTLLETGWHCSLPANDAAVFTLIRKKK